MPNVHQADKFNLSILFITSLARECHSHYPSLKILVKYLYLGNTLICVAAVCGATACCGARGLVSTEPLVRWVAPVSLYRPCYNDHLPHHTTPHTRYTTHLTTTHTHVQHSEASLIYSTLIQ